MLRKTLILVLVGVIMSVGAPATMVAQDRLSVGSLTGRALDAAGRPVGAERVELLQGTQVVSTVNTNAFGDWSFRDVKPGDYVVRVNVRGRISGRRVSIIGGQTLSGTMIVVSTASVSPQLGTLASLLTLVPTAATAVAATATAQAIDTETTALNDEILEAILEELSPADRVAFAQAVLEAIAEAGPSGSPFAEYVAQLTVIVATQGTVVPEFPPPTAVS